MVCPLIVMIVITFCSNTFFFLLCIIIVKKHTIPSSASYQLIHSCDMKSFLIPENCKNKKQLEIGFSESERNGKNKSKKACLSFLYLCSHHHTWSLLIERGGKEEVAEKEPYKHRALLNIYVSSCGALIKILHLTFLSLSLSIHEDKSQSGGDGLCLCVPERDSTTTGMSHLYLFIYSGRIISTQLVVRKYHSLHFEMKRNKNHAKSQVETSFKYVICLLSWSMKFWTWSL